MIEEGQVDFPCDIPMKNKRQLKSKLGQFTEIILLELYQFRGCASGQRNSPVGRPLRRRGSIAGAGAR